MKKYLALGFVVCALLVAAPTPSQADQRVRVIQLLPTEMEGDPEFPQRTLPGQSREVAAGESQVPDVGLAGEVRLARKLLLNFLRLSITRM